MEGAEGEEMRGELLCHTASLPPSSQHKALLPLRRGRDEHSTATMIKQENGYLPPQTAACIAKRVQSINNN